MDEVELILEEAQEGMEKAIAHLKNNCLTFAQEKQIQACWAV